MHLQKVRNRRPKSEREYASLEDRFYALIKKPAEAILMSTEFSYNVFFHDTEDFVNAGSKRVFKYIKMMKQKNNPKFFMPSDKMIKETHIGHRIAFLLTNGTILIDDDSNKSAVHIVETRRAMLALVKRTHRVAEVKEWPGYLKRILHNDGYTERVAEYL
tara:strand:- start:221 stop:700 length:480 start_codon:yes stop_codon:yes gene_type:complete